MSDHLSSENLEDYRRSALPPVELLAVDDHLAACEQCRARLADAARGRLLPGPALDAAWQTLRLQLHPGAERIEHLSYNQLAAHVDEQLGGAERQAVEIHLESCEMCAAELQDLRAFSHEVAALPSPEPSPANPAPGVSSPNWWWQFKDLLTARWPVLAGASALLLVIAGLFYSQLRVDPQTPPLVAAITPTPTPSSPGPAATEDIASTPIEVLVLNDGGGRVTVDTNGRLVTPQPFPPAYEQIITRALTTGRVEIPALAGLNVKTGSLMGGGENAPFKLLGPVAKVVETDQPDFRWQPLAGATSYTVMVYDANFSRVTASPSLAGTQWRPPQPLARGAVYSWQVKAMKDGREIAVPEPPAPEAKFKILERSKADELEGARRQFANSHLTLGLLYARSGMLNEAEREFHALAEANQTSPLARKLLRTVTAASR